MNGFATILRVVICFVILTDLTKVLLSFVWLKFSSFGWDHDGWRNKEREPKLGDAHRTPSYYSRRNKQLSLGLHRKVSPLSSNDDLYFTWSYIFIRHISWVYPECLVLYEPLLFLVFALGHLFLLNTPIWESQNYAVIC